MLEIGSSARVQRLLGPWFASGNRFHLSDVPQEANCRCASVAVAQDLELQSLPLSGHLRVTVAKLPDRLGTVAVFAKDLLDDLPLARGDRRLLATRRILPALRSFCNWFGWS